MVNVVVSEKVSMNPLMYCLVEGELGPLSFIVTPVTLLEIV